MLVRILSGSQKGQMQDLPQVNAEQAILFGFAEKCEEPAAPATKPAEAPSETPPADPAAESVAGQSDPSGPDLDAVSAEADAAAATEKPAE